MRSSKILLKTGIMIAVLVCILLLLDFALYPCTFMRNDVHAVANNTYDDVYMGTSHGKMNIDPSAVLADSGRTGHNICVGGEYSIDTYYMIRMMVERGHKPERIVYELSPGYYVREKEEGNNYLLFYHEFPMGRAKLAYFADAVAKCNFRTLFFPWYEYQLSYELEHLQETVRKKLNRDYSADGFATETQKYHEDGFIERYPVDPEEFDWDTMEEIYPEDLVQKNIDYLKKIIEYCQEQGIEFVSVVTPLQDDVLAEFSEGYEALDKYFAELMTEYDVQYINFNTDPYYGLAAHDPKSFTDLDGHMNGDAAREFSLTLSQVLNGSGEIPEEDTESEEYEEDPETEAEDEPELLG
ncbi:MAG: hypothetical protein IKF16_00410 [Lachnospiraceae bacterium]|nr:hypothetical protein [Lachnospiraceae bacterium]